MAVWSILPFKKIDLTDRFDAEYFQPSFLEIATKLEGKGTKLGDLAKFVCSAFYPAATHLYEIGDVPFIRGVDVISHPVIVGDQPFEKLPQSFIDEHREIQTVHTGDVVITKVGTPCHAGIVHESLGHAALSRTVLGVREIDQGLLDPYYLVVFLRSDYGFYQLMREREQQIQLQLTLHRVGNINIYLPPLRTQRQIGDVLRRYYSLLDDSKRLYIEAQDLILEELGLKGLVLSSQGTYMAIFSETTKARRFDAEYFQPRYQALFQRIRDTGQAVRLSDVVAEPIRRGVLPEYVEKGEVLVINSQHIGKTQIELDANRSTTWEFCQTGKNSRAIVRRYDVLLNSTGYITIGRCQTLLRDVRAIVDGHVSIIRPKDDLDPVYLGVYLNGLPGQLQTERGWTGSSGQIELRTEVIGDFVVWKAPTEVQQYIRQLVEKSHQTHQEAEQLLEEAKGKVEQMILAEG